MENEDAEASVPQIVKLVQDNLPKYYHVEPSQIQVLTPMQRGVVGATDLNLSLQEALNPSDHEIFMRGRGKVTMQKECLPIHKAQGSEYPIVVMPIMMNHFVMLQRNLIYTGITRAKKVLVIVGTKKALAYAVKNVTVTKRNTLLKERMAGA